ncbi:MAG: YihY/virulence factor BrkB family protein [Pseudomonadota bacterium]
MSRDGRTAQNPQAIGRQGWLDIGYRTVQAIGQKNLSLMAAGAAFYGLMSLFPGLAAVVAISGMLISPDLLVTASDRLAGLLPEAARTIIMDQLRELTATDEAALNLAAIFAVLVALFLASRAVQNVIIGLNVVYDEDEERGFFKILGTNVVMTLGIIFGMILSVIVVAGLPAFAAWATLPAWLDTLLDVLRWPLLFLIGAGGISILYRHGPCRRAARWRWIRPGAILACLLWVLGSAGFSFYVQSFGNYNETFGTLGGVVILLTWLWLSAFIVLLGALVDAETEAQTRHDSTIGPDRPMGERGAVKADTLGRGWGERKNPDPV